MDELGILPDDSGGNDYKDQPSFDFFDIDGLVDKESDVRKQEDTSPEERKDAEEVSKTAASFKTSQTEIKVKTDTLTPKHLRRSVLAWLAQQNPSCVGEGVPTRISRYKADIAALWSLPVRHVMHPEKTVIVEIRHNREQCWPDCSRKEELLPLLREKKAEKEEFQTMIRREEPALRSSESLFEEFDCWDYHKSENKDYHRCCRKIEEIEYALYGGSRFEQIRRAHVADFLYLAVPEDSVHPHELADGWGLLYVKEDFSVELVKEAENWNCPEENKYHLLQNIAASTLNSVLFSSGIRINSRGKVVFTPIPKRRRGKV